MKSVVGDILSFVASKANEQGLTHQSIADKMGFKRQNVGRLLNGKVDPKLSTFLNLCDSTDISLTDIDNHLKETR